MSYAVGAAWQQRRIALARCRPTPPQCNRRRRGHCGLATVCSAVLNHRRGRAQAKSLPPHAPVGAMYRAHALHPAVPFGFWRVCERDVSHSPDAPLRRASEKPKCETHSRYALHCR